MLFLGSTDTSPSPADGRKLAELVKQGNRNVEVVIYEGAGHGFHADYRQSYDAWSATQAWKLCVDFFNKNLKA